MTSVNNIIINTFYNDILKGGDNEGNPKLVRVLADNALNGAEWLKDYINMTFEDRQMFFGGHSVERSLVPLGATGVEMISKLLAKAEELNIPVFCQLCKIQPGLIVKKYLSLPFLRKMCYNDNGIFCNRRKLL